MRNIMDGTMELWGDHSGADKKKNG